MLQTRIEHIQKKNTNNMYKTFYTSSTNKLIFSRLVTISNAFEFIQTIINSQKVDLAISYIIINLIIHV